jgi:hypothetical protein
MELSETSEIIGYAITALQKDFWVSQIYAMLAQSYRSKDPKLAERLVELSNVEKAHAAFWSQLLAKRKHHITASINPVRYAIYKILYTSLMEPHVT